MTDRRIVLFTAGHTEPNGGLAQHSRLLVEGFAAEGWDVRAISRAGTLRRPVLVREQGLVVLEMPGFGSARLGAALYLLVAVPLGLWWARGATGCLSVHLGSTTVAAGVVSATWRVRHLALSTSSGPYGEVSEAARCRPHGLRRRLLRRATLVAQSDATAPELRALTTPDRIAVVPNPVLLPPPTPLSRAPRVLFLGRLSQEKGADLLIAAWRQVVTAMPDAQLDIVGAGGTWRSTERDLRAEVERDPLLRSSIRFAGWTDDVGAELRTHDVFVQSSTTFEGMSNSLLEACAARRVIVASDIAPNVAVLGSDHPLLFPSGDAHALAERLLVALQDTDVADAAADGAHAAVQRNAVPAVVAAFAALLDQDRTTSS